jgi:hypothetical protein
MNKINIIFEKYGVKILAILLLLFYVRTCSIQSKIKSLSKSSELNTEYIYKLPTSLDLKIEGLRVEKRMIQATDRKMLDVQRQNQIEKEIKELELKIAEIK